MRRSLTIHQLSPERTLIRPDGHSGNGAVLSDLAGFASVTRGNDSRLLDHPLIQARLHVPPDQVHQRPESQTARSLSDCPEIPVGPDGVPCRVIVATHPAGKNKSPSGVTRSGIVYERFFTNLPQHAFTARDVVERSLHRGAFEPLLADEDQELDPDRWCSHSDWGQKWWHVVAQWVWNLRLELGHQVEPTPLRMTECAPAIALQREQATARLVSSPPPSGDAPPTTATSWKADRFTGSDVPLQPDGTLRCPAGQKLVSQEQRREADGSLRVVSGASMRRCRPCPLRERCPWNGAATAKPRQVSVLLHPRPIGSAPLLWRDWSRNAHRRAWRQLLRHQRIEVNLSPPPATALPITNLVLSRAQRARSRLSWSERLVRNGRTHTAGPVTIRLFGVPVVLAPSLDVATASTACTSVACSLLGHARFSEEPSRALFPDGSLFFLSFVRSALHPAGSIVSHGLPL